MMHTSWWNTLPLSFDGVFLTIGGFSVRYYGLAYLAAFWTCYQAILITARREKLPITREQLEGFAGWMIAGILLGGRLGYVLFYNLHYFMAHPIEIIKPFSTEGGFHFTGISGMSYHGGMIGATVMGSIYVIRHKLDYWLWSNVAFYTAPLGYTWGRLGNYVNGELWGRPTDAAIGQYFKADHLHQLRHPSQLYEATFEGLALFGILHLLRKRPAFREHMMALYIGGYGFFRFFIEFFREPDAHIGLNTMGLSRGQLLCMAMMLAAAIIYFWRKSRLAHASAK